MRCIDIDLASPSHFSTRAIISHPRVHNGVGFLDERIAFGFDLNLDTLFIKHIAAVVTFGPLPEPGAALPDATLIDAVMQCLPSSVAVTRRLNARKADVSALKRAMVSVGKTLYAHENAALATEDGGQGELLGRSLQLCRQCDVVIPGLNPFMVYVDVGTAKAIAGMFPMYRWADHPWWIRCPRIGRAARPPGRPDDACVALRRDPSAAALAMRSRAVRPSLDG